MSAVLAVIARLEAVSAVTALVSTRIYQGILPQGGTFPKIRVQRVSEDQPMQLRGGIGIYASRVQIDSVSDASDPVAAATALDAAVFGTGAGSALVGFKGPAGTFSIEGVFPSGIREGYDPVELRQYKVMRDVTVWWKT